MNRHIARLAAVTGVTLLGLAASTNANAADLRPVQASVSESCTGSLNVSNTGSSASVTGSVTCAGLTPLSLTTTVTAAGVTSSVTSLLTALPGVALPINVTVPTVNASLVCATLVDTTTGVTVASTCTA